MSENVVQFPAGGPVSSVPLSTSRDMPMFKGSGGEGGDGMEARIARLEADVAELRSDVKGLDGRLRGVETGLATLTERVAHLPSKEYMFRMALLIVGAVGAFALFGDHLKVLLGLH